MKNVYDITEFGAVGDSKKDCTKAIQAALDKASEVEGCVIVPPGKYMCGYIKVPERVCFMGFHGWGYRDFGGSVLILNDSSVKCMVDMTGAHASMIQGLQLIGNNQLGDNIHGIMTDWETYNGGSLSHEQASRYPFYDIKAGEREDSFVIDDCQIRSFSGDGLHLKHVFAFTVRNSYAGMNGGSGIYLNGWDGWIFDCIIVGNEKYGIGYDGDGFTASFTITGNRIEWNRKAGMCFKGITRSLNITANFIDRSFGPAIDLSGKNEKDTITITGNILRRSGRPRAQGNMFDLLFAKEENMILFESEYESSHIFMENCTGTTVVGNSFACGRDDGKAGVFSPEYSVVYKKLSGCVISNNSMAHSCMVKSLVDLGYHTDENVICNNAGKDLCEPQAQD